MDAPLRLSRDRIFLFGSGLSVVGLLLVYSHIRTMQVADWPTFWSGGATVGTSALLNSRELFAFQQAHGLNPMYWPYLPAFAWVFLPASHLTIPASYIINACVMLALAAISGWFLAKVFDLPGWFGAAAALAWAPVYVAAADGQNTPIALSLIVVAMVAARRHSDLLLGTAVGLLLYKPTIALPFILLLLARREWRALFAVAACLFDWYFAGVAATGGDWHWMPHYADVIRAWYGQDSIRNASKVVSIPGLLMNLGVPAYAAAASGIVILLALLPRLARASWTQALSITSVLTVAVSPHAWPYEAVIALPAIFYAMRAVAEPPRTWLLSGAYVLATASIFNLGLRWNLLAVFVLLWTALVVFCRAPEPSVSSGLPTRV